MTVMNYTLLLLLLSPAVYVDAFPTGTGICRENAPTVAGSHLRRSDTVAGSLSNGSIDVQINGASLSASSMATLTMGKNHTITVAGNPSFRGFLVRVGGAGTGALSVEDPSSAQISIICTSGGVSGVTHVNNSLKTSVSTILNVPFEGSLTLDITIVIENRGSRSEYYFTGYNLIIEQAPNVVDIAIMNNFTTLVAAIQAANLTDTLTTGGPFTVFAPTNAAFALLGADNINNLLSDLATLSMVLLYHVVSGVVSSSDLVVGSIPTVQGENIAITKDILGMFLLNYNTRLVTTDMIASNGIVHVIDRVLVPPSFPMFPTMMPSVVPSVMPSMSLTPSEITTPIPKTSSAPTCLVGAKYMSALLLLVATFLL